MSNILRYLPISGSRRCASFNATHRLIAGDHGTGIPTSIFTTGLSITRQTSTTITDGAIPSMIATISQSAHIMGAISAVIAPIIRAPTTVAIRPITGITAGIGGHPRSISGGRSSIGGASSTKQHDGSIRAVDCLLTSERQHAARRAKISAPRWKTTVGKPLQRRSESRASP